MMKRMVETRKSTTGAMNRTSEGEVRLILREDQFQ